jgi:Protein of unknown function (DUF3102)
MPRKGLVRRAVEDIVDIGRALNRQRDALPHGSFLPWVDAEFGWQERMVQRFMSIATKFEMANPSHLTGLSMHALTELAMPSTPPEVQVEVERRIAAGEIQLPRWKTDELGRIFGAWRRRSAAASRTALRPPITSIRP